MSSTIVLLLFYLYCVVIVENKLDLSLYNKSWVQIGTSGIWVYDSRRCWTPSQI